ncbi:MAG: hypothetical protein F6J94_30955 [Moorea sp. SIO1F2]|uniref:hypothetical protein n=1 Tax=Moorena sp. SIO1F2 TaxID=2607819 RepID=UPI0013B8EAEC|nr:hypothetical protein [Moorena sp. SIO1F2]NET86138.1 hypothetical protein [Moorena sp. SIO1F2]
MGNGSANYPLPITDSPLPTPHSRFPTPRECAFTLSFEKARGRTAPDSPLPTQM